MFILLAAPAASRAAAAAKAETVEKSHLVIEIKTKTLTLYINGKPSRKYQVAIGKPDSPTPVGEWKIEYKARNWGNGFGTRWMGLSVPWGLYGIHGTNKPWQIGSCISHGCIRMFNEDVEELYDLVTVGTKVIVRGQIFPPFYEERRILHEGQRGSDVMLLQKQLIDLGYLKGEIDGYFGSQTEKALKRFQKDHFFKVTGQVNADIYAAIGL
jgi:hypothetical protein